MKRTTLLVAGVAALVVSTPGAYAGPTDATSTLAAPYRQSVVRAAVTEEEAPILRLTLNEGAESAGDVLWRLHSSGLASVEAVVLSSDGGKAVRVSGRSGTWGVRLPAFSSEAAPPRAVIRVQGTGVGDPLEPGQRDFRFGAAWNLDTESQGSDADNGDNLVQRGLFGAGAQFKLQIDDRVPMCSVEGDEGVVVAKAERVKAEEWYRARCVREGDELMVRVWELTQNGAVALDSTTVRGPIGSVSFDALTPLSIGGKLTSSGELVRSSGDQFNGVIDNVVYDSVS